ncbi:MAG: hypothetical protein ACE5JK_00910 [Candidatus Omnitrophota bacterium]
MKAIALLSGGLDSILATKLILEQGIEVEAVNFLTVFCNCTSRGKTCLASKLAADQLGIKLKVFEISSDYFEIIKNPKYGYGRNINPCLDCRVFMFKKAYEYMKETGASFVITGEVLGERPMSQRREAIRIIEKGSGLGGLLVRPLSAKLFEPSIPEKEGWVDREKFLEIKGRSRKPQMQLADQLGINDYPCPAGGCLLTDGGFSRRMRDLMEHKNDFDVNDVKLLKTGRLFRLSPDAKLISGRSKEENEGLLALSREGDVIFRPINVKGPVGIGRGIFDEESLKAAARIIARYGDADLDQETEVSYKALPEEGSDTIKILPARENELNNLRI